MLLDPLLQIARGFGERFQLGRPQVQHKVRRSTMAEPRRGR
ncbi:hypothetical protein OG762_46990 (plasmid) [Streptomyces sp. NBC_01136]|nr:hypothetical protein OG762_46990 [Streptomyces sp. NBC_01136]